MGETEENIRVVEEIPRNVIRDIGNSTCIDININVALNILEAIAHIHVGMDNFDIQGIRNSSSRVLDVYDDVPIAHLDVYA